MAPKYKLTYFNVTGLGEPIRYILSYGKLDFDDVRVEFSNWQGLKESVTFGKLPILEEDGVQLHQTLAICRYLGKKIGIGGKTDLDSAQADIAADTITDYRLFYTAAFRAEEDKKPQLMEEIKKTHNPYYLSRFEKIVGDNGGYFVNNQLTWVDLFFASLTDLLANLAKEPILDPYPNLKALKEKVDKLPGIVEYRAKRPKTDI